jgi:hypothetical protein
VAATDADGDPLSIAWSSFGTPLGDRPDLEFVLCGCPRQNPSIISPLTATVSDGQGGRVTASVPFTIASLTGAVDGYYDDGRGDWFMIDLTQTGTP